MTGGSPWTRRALAAVGIFGLVFLTVPLLIVVPMSFSSARALTFPPPGFSLRWYEAFFGDPRWMDAMWTSMIVALLSSIAALVLGSLAAYGLDFDSVQRGNAEIERRAQEVLDRCWQLGAANPVLSVHDVGAGGLSNAIPEIAYAAGRGTFHHRTSPTCECAPGPIPHQFAERQ